MKKFQQFIDIVKGSKTFDEAFSKCSSVQNVPAETAQAFRDEYDPTHKLSPRQAFTKFYNEALNY